MIEYRPGAAFKWEGFAGCCEFSADFEATQERLRHQSLRLRPDG